MELNEKLHELTKGISDHIYNQDLFERKFDDNFFDVIYMRDVIEHIHNPGPFIEELFRIAKKGGVVMFCTHNIDSLVNALTIEYHTVIFAFEHPVHWSPVSLKYAGEQAGFIHQKTCQYHEGQSLRNILAYHLNPSFTYIFKDNVKAGWMKKLLFKLTGLPVLFRLDRLIMKSLSKLLSRGATMNVIFTK